MREYYLLMDALKDYLQENPNVNTIHEGDFFKLDLSKETVFPLLNINVVSVEFLKHYQRFTIQVIAADIVDETFENEKDVENTFHGSNNLQDIYNSQLSVINKLQTALKRGSLFNVDYVLAEEDSATATPFEQRFKNLLAGWVLDIVIDVANDEISSC